MAIVFTNGGRSLSASYTVGKTTTVSNLTLRLYSNDLTPNFASDATSFTEVTTGNGYAPITLTGATWSVSDGAATYPQQTWTFTGSKGNIYGYYVTVGSGTTQTVVFAERFTSGPFNIASNGDIIRVTIAFSVTQN